MLKHLIIIDTINDKLRVCLILQCNKVNDKLPLICMWHCSRPQRFQVKCTVGGEKINIVRVFAQ